MGSSSSSSSSLLPGPENSKTAGTSGFSSLPRGGLSVGSFAAVDRSISPWSSMNGDIGVVSSLLQHFDVVALVGNLVSEEEINQVASVLVNDFEVGSYVVEFPFLYSVGAVERRGELFEVASGGAVCSVFCFEYC